MSIGNRKSLLDWCNGNGDYGQQIINSYTGYKILDKEPNDDKINSNKEPKGDKINSNKEEKGDKINSNKEPNDDKINSNKEEKEEDKLKEACELSDISKGSEFVLEFKCKRCSELFNRTPKSITQVNHSTGKFYCPSCARWKRKIETTTLNVWMSESGHKRNLEFNYEEIEKKKLFKPEYYTVKSNVEYCFICTKHNHLFNKSINMVTRSEFKPECCWDEIKKSRDEYLSFLDWILLFWHFPVYYSDRAYNGAFIYHRLAINERNKLQECSFANSSNKFSFDCGKIKWLCTPFRITRYSCDIIDNVGRKNYMKYPFCMEECNGHICTNYVNTLNNKYKIITNKNSTLEWFIKNYPKRDKLTESAINKLLNEYTKNNKKFTDGVLEFIKLNGTSEL